MTARLTDAELDVLERLARDALGGPLKIETGRGSSYVVSCATGIAFYRSVDGFEDSAPHFDDARYFIAAVNVLPSLLAEVREMRAFDVAICDAARLFAVPRLRVPTLNDRMALVTAIGEWRVGAVEGGARIGAAAATLRDACSAANGEPKRLEGHVADVVAELGDLRAKLARVEGYRERLAAALESDDRVIAGGGDLDGALHEAAEHARSGGFDDAIFGKDGE